MGRHILLITIFALFLSLSVVPVLAHNVPLYGTVRRGTHWIWDCQFNNVIKDATVYAIRLSDGQIVGSDVSNNMGGFTIYVPHYEGYKLKAVKEGVEGYTGKIYPMDKGSSACVPLDIVDESNKPPVAKFTANPTSSDHAPLTVNFDASWWQGHPDGSYDPDGTIKLYYWNFGDGHRISSTSAHAQHTYYSSGEFTVTLTVTDNGGAKSSYSLKIIIGRQSSNLPPLASFTADPITGEAPLLVNFDASKSSDSNGYINSYSWDFGDGVGGAGKKISYKYSEVGTFTVKLTVFDNDLESDFTTMKITVTDSSEDVSAKEMVEHYAPVWYQDTNADNPKADYIVKFDFDGDFIGNNNWENLNKSNVDLSANIYYSVVATNTHWFLGYWDFHPRDWKGFGTWHENDMEGAFLVIKKDGEKFGSLEFMKTYAHGSWETYGKPSILFHDETHPKLYVQEKGHGVYAFSSEQFKDGDGVVYYYKSQAQVPQDGNDRDVGYQLVDIQVLWNKRDVVGSGKTFNIKSSIFCGQYHYFDQDNKGIFAVIRPTPPWGIMGDFDNSYPCGELFFDPYAALSSELGPEASSEYVLNDYENPYTDIPIYSGTLIVFEAYSPINLTIYDSSGNILSSGNVFLSEPGSEPKLAMIFDPIENYKLEINGTDNGDFILIASKRNGTEVISSYYLDVPVTPDFRGIININGFDIDDKMLVDRNDDGIFEDVIRPLEIDIGFEFSADAHLKVHDISVGDINNDGLDELVVVGDSPSIYVYRVENKRLNLIDKTDIGITGYLWRIVIGDVNSDGKNELMVSGRSGIFAYKMENNKLILLDKIAGRFDDIKTFDLKNGELKEIFATTSNKIMVLKFDGKKFVFNKLSTISGLPSDVDIIAYVDIGDVDADDEKEVVHFSTKYTSHCDPSYLYVMDIDDNYDISNLRSTSYNWCDGNAFDLLLLDTDRDGKDEIYTASDTGHDNDFIGIRKWTATDSEVLLKYDKKVAADNKGYAHDLLATDLNADGRIEILLATNYWGAAIPNPLGVFILDGETLQTLKFFKSPFNVALWRMSDFKDVDNDGKKEITFAGYNEIEVWGTDLPGEPHIVNVSVEEREYSVVEGIIEVVFDVITPVPVRSIILLDDTIIDKEIVLSTLEAGLHRLTIYVEDIFGNIGTITKFFTLFISDGPPITSLSLIGIQGNNGWFMSDVELILEAIDKETEVDKIFYKSEGFGYEEYTEPIKLRDNGIEEISYYSVDDKNNKEDERIAEIKIDKNPPILIIDSPDQGTYFWTETLSFDFEAVDFESGLFTSYAQIGDNRFNSKETVSLSSLTHGKHNMTFYAEDIAGNTQEIILTIFVMHDITPPVTTDNHDTEWHTEDIIVTLISEDELSNVTEIHYIVNSGSEQVVTTDEDGIPGDPFVVNVTINYENNNNTLEYWAIDEWNNVEDHTIAYNIKLDKTKPLTIDDYNNQWCNQDISIRLIANDPIVQGNPSGVEETYYIIYQDEVSQGTKTLSIDGQPLITYEDDDNWLEYWSIDIAGNIEDHNLFKGIKLDKTPPLVSIWLDPVKTYYSHLESLPVQYSAEDSQVQGTPSNQLTLVWDIDGTIVDDPTDVTEWVGTHTLTLTATDLAGNSNSSSVEFTVALELVGEDQLKITPEALKKNPGILTVHINFPYPYNLSEITNATCDYASYDKIAGHNIKFRRKDIEAALAERGEELDIHFEVEGQFLYDSQQFIFFGSDNITKIVD